MKRIDQRPIMVCLRPSRRLQRVLPSLCVEVRHWVNHAAMRAAIPLYPRGPRSGPGYVVPVLHRLLGPIRPTRRHAPTSPPCGLYAAPALCRLLTSLSSPRVVPSFRIPFLLSLSSSHVPGESIDCLHPGFIDGVRLRPPLPRTRHSRPSTSIRFTWNPFSGLPGSLTCYNRLSC